MADRASNRLKSADAGRVLDSAARERRLRKQLEALDHDNYHEDPHANLQVHKQRPKFDDDIPSSSSGTPMAKRQNSDRSSRDTPGNKKKKKLLKEHNKQRFRKTFQQLVEEELMARPDQPNYLSAKVPPSRLPARHFCAVCGHYSNYTCIQCGARYCKLKCLETHKDTRCLKWTV